MLLLDTDVIIDYLRNRKEIVSKLQKLYQQGKLVHYSPLSKAEVYAGLRKGEEKNTAAFFNLFTSVPVTDDVGEQAGHYLMEYSKSNGVHTVDALIAATAKLSGFALWTRNRKHYPMKGIRFV